MKHALDAAPALTRGLALLRLLEGEALATLEHLARRARLPKASALRLLRALQAAGLIAREPAGKRWRAIARIVPTADAEEILRARHASDLEMLCGRSGQVAELYIRDGDALRMIDRREPPTSEVTLRAQIGFVRPLDEIEAVAQLGLAHRIGRVRARHWHYRSGKPVTITQGRAEQLVAAARASGWATDVEPNSNGVRRTAAPLLDERGQLTGVIAVAALGADTADQRLRRLRDLVLSAARRPLPHPARK